MKRYYYHAAPVESRKSITAHGLRPGTDASYGPPAVYLFRSNLFAENYLSDVVMDVYRVDTKGFSVYPDPEDPAAAAYVEHAIPASRLRYEGTFLNGEPCDENGC